MLPCGAGEGEQRIIQNVPTLERKNGRPVDGEMSGVIRMSAAREPESCPVRRGRR